jgi:hypothetical protein
LWIIFGHGKEYFDISEEYMSQRIYDNYLGIFGMMEMWVASQLRANRVIPLIEKGIFPRKEILGLVQDGNDMVSGWFWGWQATREEKWTVIPPGCRTIIPQKSKSGPNQRKRKWAKSRVLQFGLPLPSLLPPLSFPLR